MRGESRFNLLTDGVPMTVKLRPIKSKVNLLRKLPSYFSFKIQPFSQFSIAVACCCSGCYTSSLRNAHGQDLQHPLEDDSTQIFVAIKLMRGQRNSMHKCYTFETVRHQTCEVIPDSS